MYRLALVALALSTAVTAQTVPGTFSTVPPEQEVPSILPLVSTPTLTLSNGFTPATVTMPQTMVVEQPLNVLEGTMPQSDLAFNNDNGDANQLNKGDFNFAVVNPQSAFNFGTAGPSLGEIARQFNAGHVQAHKTYTNADIEHLTSEIPESGIIAAKLANGQPITDRNQSGFSPMSGIANMPDVTNNAEGTEFANRNAADQNPANEGQGNATASNADQGQPSGQNATMPSADASKPAENSGNQQMPASDTNPR
jgi:hypothetical protein